MPAYTKKELVKKLNDFYEDKDLIFALLWTKDEFEASFDRDIKKKDWETTVESIDTQSSEHEIKELIEGRLMEVEETQTV